MASARYHQNVLSSATVAIEREADLVHQSASSIGSATVNVETDHIDQIVPVGDGIEGLEDCERRLQE